MMRLPLAVALIALGTSGCSKQVAPGIQQIPALAGEQLTLVSPQTRTRYHVFIRLPQDYGRDPNKRYPVVYVLDGDSLFPLIAAQHLFMTIDDGAPEAIIVGIGYGSFAPGVNRRDRDYLDGAAAFLSFLKADLIPNVESRVRVDPSLRILFGQSRGGRFVLRTAYLDPDLFWGRIASNPGAEPNGKLFETDVAPHTGKGAFMVVVNGTKDRPANVKAFTNWQASRSAMQTVALPVPGGTHSADAGRAYREGMSFLMRQGKLCEQGDKAAVVALEGSCATLRAS